MYGFQLALLLFDIIRLEAASVTMRLFSNGKLSATAAIACAAQLGSVYADDKSGSSSKAIVVDGLSFALNGDNVSYRFHVDNTTGDLVGDHFGGPVDEDGIGYEIGPVQGWVNLIGRQRREFPDLGRGDFRTPAVQIKQAQGHMVSYFRYESHDVIDGKPDLEGLPSTFGKDGDVSSLVVHLYDNYSSVAADLTYSIFPKYDAVVRSVKLTNRGNGTIELDKVTSFSVDLQHDDLDMLELQGEWSREATRVRRQVGFGSQGFQSSTGFSSHLHNPFVALIDRTATESTGDAWGFSLVYTGDFAVEVEKSTHSITRATIGLNPTQLRWPLKPGESFVSPEAVAVFSDQGVGGMSRKFHRLYRKHLMKSKFASEMRPVLLNSWEGLGFDINETSVNKLAQEAADLGVKLFVMDDGWFANGVNARINDTAGLGDWDVNTDKFPQGLTPMIENITQLEAAGSDTKLQFGLWFEPEMVNPDSLLYKAHPDWVLHAGSYPRTLTRNQLILNVALPEVQEHIIESLAKYLRSAPITFIKWDNNRGIHETPGPNLDHHYMLGLYRVFQNLTTDFPDVIWNGCASGGGRFDPGILQYFPQVWTSDDTDAVERIAIQFGTSLVYPASAMGAHISHVPNWLTSRETSVRFRAHVAMMGGSFGLELDPSDMDEDEKAEIPDLIKLAEEVQPIVTTGDQYRLGLPGEAKYPAAIYVSEDGEKAVFFAFQTRATINTSWPRFRLQGLDKDAKYKYNGTQVVSGATLMNSGVQLRFRGDQDSKVIILEKQ